MKDFQLVTLNALMKKKDMLLVVPTGFGKTVPLELFILAKRSSRSVTILIVPTIVLGQTMAKTMTKHNILAWVITGTVLSNGNQSEFFEGIICNE